MDTRKLSSHKKDVAEAHTKWEAKVSPISWQTLKLTDPPRCSPFYPNSAPAPCRRSVNASKIISTGLPIRDCGICGPSVG